jgi:hypothetical protein
VKDELPALVTVSFPTLLAVGQACLAHIHSAAAAADPIMAATVDAAGLAVKLVCKCFLAVIGVRVPVYRPLGVYSCPRPCRLHGRVYVTQASASMPSACVWACACCAQCACMSLRLCLASLPTLPSCTYSLSDMVLLSLFLCLCVCLCVPVRLPLSLSLSLSPCGTQLRMPAPLMSPPALEPWIRLLLAVVEVEVDDSV